MAGLSEEGYTIKRLSEILEDLRNKAQEIFADLVPEGDIVNTDNNSVLGRMIGIIAPSLSDNWEASQEVYDAFNINAATGVSLDNLCALGGVTRQAAASTSTSVLLKGDLNTVIPASTKVQSVNNSRYHSVTDTTTLDVLSSFEITVNVLTVANSTAYTITYLKVPDSLSEGIFTITITSDGSATEAEILAALETEINTNHNTVLTASVDGTDLIIQSLDEFAKITFTVDSNLIVTKVEKLATVTCDDTGAIEQPANSITKIPVPIVGWDSVRNPTSGVTGRDIENDAELRARYKIAKFGDGDNLIESLYSALYALDGVESVVIVENDTDTAFVSAPMVPAHSFLTVVQGGTSEEIARAIWNNKPAGILAWGANTVTVNDSQGIGHDVSYSTPTPVDIYIEVNITTQADFAPDGADQIKAALVEHFNNLLIGDDVIYSRLYTPINSISGFYVDSLDVDTSFPPSGTSNIAMAYNERAVITEANITVVV